MSAVAELQAALDVADLFQNYSFEWNWVFIFRDAIEIQVQLTDL